LEVLEKLLEHGTSWNEIRESIYLDVHREYTLMDVKGALEN
jgi:hypothetical protein